MYNVNITNARNDLYNLVDMAISDNEPINIVTKKGNAVIISEDDYNAILETLYLSSDAKYKQSLINAKNEPVEDCIELSEVDW